MYKTWAGNTIEWFYFEALIYLTYLGTMMLLLIKSRFSRVGVDQSGQFEPVYLQKMIDMIALNIDFKLEKSEQVQKERID